MITPQLARAGDLQDQQERLREKDLSTYGFLGYPPLQSADILVTGWPGPAGEDQVVHVDDARGRASLQPYLRP